MNLLGKICVVLILVASLVFMTLSMAVYATHTNWYLAVNRPGGLQDQLDEQIAENNRLKDRYNDLQSRLEAETAQLAQQLIKAETARASLEEENIQIDQQLGNLQTQLRTANATVSATQDQNNRLSDRVDTLQQGIREEQTKRDQLFQMAKDATLELQQKLGVLNNLQERLSQILPQLARLRGLATSMRINPDLPVDFVPDVDGVIRVVRQEGAQKLIEVSIGSHDGLQRGTELLIYRGGRYLGKAEVKETWPDEAVCEVIPGSVEGNIQAGDRVATRV